MKRNNTKTDMDSFAKHRALYKRIHALEHEHGEDAVRLVLKAARHTPWKTAEHLNKALDEAFGK